MLYYESYEKFLKWCENHPAAGILIVLGAIILMMICMRMVLRTSYDDKRKKKLQRNQPIQWYKGAKSWIMRCLSLNSLK